jgi:hypothetical protein
MEPPALEGRYRHVLTIPAFDEPADFLDGLLERVEDREVLCIVVVNVPDDAEPAAVARTERLLGAIAKRPHTLVIDRASEPIPRREGVGLARRLAADVACAFIYGGQIDVPFIFMTDADARLPPDYFHAVRSFSGQTPSAGVVLYPFEHHSDDPDLTARAILYELHLHHYVQGLVDAGSPYAFQTLGSTIAIHARTYARVRGVPRRNAAEDFYLLNKAAKVDPVLSLARPAVRLEARLSRRVPFGTGPALERQPADPEQALSYAPAAFAALGDTLAALERFSVQGIALDLSSTAAVALAELGFPSEHFAAAHPPGPRRRRAVMEWFDGFRTMRFVRLLERQHPQEPLLESWRRRLGSAEPDPAGLLAEVRRLAYGRGDRTAGL